MDTGNDTEAGRRQWQATRPYRIIHSLYVEFVPVPPEPPESTTALVINLDRKGMGTGRAKPRPPQVRCIDLRVGDEILNKGRWRTIRDITVYRDGWLDESMIGDRNDGYIYRPRSNSPGDEN